MSRRRNAKNFLTGRAFVAHRKEMLESVAWRALSINARRFLDRLEIEHMAHGGAENGRLVCPYDDLEKYGVRRQQLPETIAEVEALGFVEVTRRGYMGSRSVAEKLPSLYRLTYPIESRDYAPVPTDEWRRFSTDEEANRAVELAKREVEERRTLSREQRAAPLRRVSERAA